jgi:glycolate oxidase iron-sulfur subunit
MQTNFTPEQLRQNGISEADGILRKCVHCGFCTATCPTYVTLGNELDSPRGRIYMIKDYLENDRKADDVFALHMDRCLSCYACLTTCPSGVDYMHLSDFARNHITKTYKRPLIDRTIRKVLTLVLPYPNRFRAALSLAKLGKPFAGIFEKIKPLKPLAAMLRLAPNQLPAQKVQEVQPVKSAKSRVIVMQGCAQSVLDNEINRAAHELLARLDVEVITVPNEGCCGALVQHMGEEDKARQAAKQNILAWMAEIENGGLDAILITASGCGTSVKDYGHLFKDDPQMREKAERVARLAKDITEYLTSIDLPKPELETGLRIAYHSACSMQHGQKIIREPKILLTNAGFLISEPREPHLCCGSAGTYNIMQSDIANQLKERKLANIKALHVDAVAAGNIGCITQLASDAGIPVVHTIKLLNWAYGGKKPQELADVKLEIDLNS